MKPCLPVDVTRGHFRLRAQRACRRGNALGSVEAPVTAMGTEKHQGTERGCPGHGAPHAACEVQAGSGSGSEEEVGERTSAGMREEMGVYVTTNWEKSESGEHGSPMLSHPLACPQC